MYSIEERFWSKVDKSGVCWIWLGGKNKAGYGAFRGPDGKQTTAHRTAYWLSKGEIQLGYCICHTCDNPSCVNPDHLFQGTPLDNVLDKCQKGRARGGGRYQYGEANCSAKTTEEMVKFARSLYAEGISQPEISKRTGIKRPNVWAIVHRKSWTHI